MLFKIHRIFQALLPSNSLQWRYHIRSLAP
jgi:hypothetical protein